MTIRKIKSVNAGDEMMASIPVVERRTSIPVDKMVIPSPTRKVSRGLGKPTTPQEPRDDDGQSERQQQQKAKVLYYSQLALRDYNEKHGTHLMLLDLLEYEFHFWCRGYTVDFVEMPRHWVHINLKARHLHSEKTLILFAELYFDRGDHGREPVFTRLSLLPPEDNLHGNDPWPCTIRLPFLRFRAGFDDNCPVKEEAIQTSSMMSAGAGMGKRIAKQGGMTKQEKHETCLEELALMDYNNKHGTRLKFVRAVTCHVFPGTGLSMDFKEKKTIWTHMNFVAKRHKRAVCSDECAADCYEELLLFAELYVDDDHNEHVLATLSVVDPEDNGTSCKICPASILHPQFHCFH